MFIVQLVICVAVSLWGVWQGYRLSSRPHGPPGFCRECGGNLMGRTDGRCPDCGEPVGGG